MNVVRQIIKDLGLDLQTLQSEGKLKAVEIEEQETEECYYQGSPNPRLEKLRPYINHKEKSDE